MGMAYGGGCLQRWGVGPLLFQTVNFHQKIFFSKNLNIAKFEFLSPIWVRFTCFSFKRSDFYEHEKRHDDYFKNLTEKEAECHTCILSCHIAQCEIVYSSMEQKKYKYCM